MSTLLNTSWTMTTSGSPAIGMTFLANGKVKCCEPNTTWTEGGNSFVITSQINDGYVTTCVITGTHNSGVGTGTSVLNVKPGLAPIRPPIAEAFKKVMRADVELSRYEAKSV